MRSVWMIAILFAAGLVAGDETPRNEKEITVMTRNVFVGANFEPLLDFQGGDPEDLLSLLLGTLQQAIASKFSLRMEAIADEIAQNGAIVVAIQEAAVWSISDGCTNALEYDFIRIILDHLETVYGLQYEVAVEGYPPVLDTTLSGFPGFPTVSVMFRDVVLVRKEGPPMGDLPQGHFRVIEAQTNAYENRVTNVIELVPGLPPLEIEQPRSWVSVDVEIRGRTVRVVGSHLESFDLGTRVAQAYELTNPDFSPLFADIPVIFLGDFNSVVGDDDAIDVILNNFDFDDAAYEWGDTYRDDYDLDGMVGSLGTKLIDYILYISEGLELADVHHVDTYLGEEVPVYPSDHKGIVATFFLH